MMKTILLIAATVLLASCVLDSGAGPEFYETKNWIANDTRLYHRNFPGKPYEWALKDGLGAAYAYKDIDVTAYDVVNWIDTHELDKTYSPAQEMIAARFLQREIANSKMGNMTPDGSYEALSDGINEGLSGLTHEQYEQRAKLQLAEGNYWLRHHETWQQQQADLGDPTFPARALSGQ